jgi:hypothetical protein
MQLEAAHAAVAQVLTQQQPSEGGDAAAAGAAAADAGSAAAPRPAQQQHSGEDAAAARCFLRLLDAFLERISTYKSLVLHPAEGMAGTPAVVLRHDLLTVPRAVGGMLSHHQGLLHRLQGRCAAGAADSGALGSSQEAGAGGDAAAAGSSTGAAAPLEQPESSTPKRNLQNEDDEEEDEEEDEWAAASYDPEGWLQEQLQ